MMKRVKLKKINTNQNIFIEEKKFQSQQNEKLNK